MTLILSNQDVETLLTMRDCIEVLEEVYVELSEGRGVNRRRSDCLVPSTRDGALYSLKSMDGVIPKLGIGAVRIDSDIVTWPRQGNNMRRVKVPAAPNARYVGLVLLFSSETGEPLAILPDGVMQRIRVGATNGLGVKYLARKDATSVGILGSGWHAGAQLMAACAVREIETIRCFSPDPGRCEAFAREMSATLGVEVKPVGRPDEAVGAADIAMCATQFHRQRILCALDETRCACELHQGARNRDRGNQAGRSARDPYARCKAAARDRKKPRGSGNSRKPRLGAGRGDRLRRYADPRGRDRRQGRRSSLGPRR